MTDGQCTPGQSTQLGRLVTNVTPNSEFGISNLQAGWQPVPNVNGLETNTGPKKKVAERTEPVQSVSGRSSGRVRAPPDFYQAGTSTKKGTESSKK